MTGASQMMMRKGTHLPHCPAYWERRAGEIRRIRRKPNPNSATLNDARISRRDRHTVVSEFFTLQKVGGRLSENPITRVINPLGPVPAVSLATTHGAALFEAAPFCPE
jgi:hypothetical protein